MQGPTTRLDQRSDLGRAGSYEHRRKRLHGNTLSGSIRTPWGAVAEEAQGGLSPAKCVELFLGTRLANYLFSLRNSRPRYSASNGVLLGRNVHGQHVQRGSPGSHEGIVGVHRRLALFDGFRLPSD